MNGGIRSIYASSDLIIINELHQASSTRALTEIPSKFRAVGQIASSPETPFRCVPSPGSHGRYHYPNLKYHTPIYPTLKLVISHHPGIRAGNSMVARRSTFDPSRGTGMTSGGLCMEQMRRGCSYFPNTSSFGVPLREAQFRYQWRPNNSFVQ